MSANGQPTVHTKTEILNLLRSPLRNRHLEKVLLKVTAGRPARNLMCRLIPNNYQYPRSSVREVVRHGFTMNLDVSDHLQWYVYWNFEDPSHEALISLCRPGDTVLDVGANIGLTALRMSAAVGAGRVYAFEPDPQNYQDCLNHVRANRVQNVELCKCALGAEEGTASIHQAAARNRGCIWVDKVGVAGPSSVQVTTADQFCERNGLSRVNLIKIDTEGNELAVLKGARGIIEKWKPRLFVEVDENNLQRAGDSSGALWGFLADAGYSVRHVESGRMLTSGSDLAGGHFDIICQASA